MFCYQSPRIKKGPRTSMYPGLQGFALKVTPIAVVFQAWCFSPFIVGPSQSCLCGCVSLIHTPLQTRCFSLLLVVHHSLVGLSVSLSHTHIHTPSMVFLSFIVDPSQSCLSVTYTCIHTHTLQVQCFSFIVGLSRSCLSDSLSLSVTHTWMSEWSCEISC